MTEKLDIEINDSDLMYLVGKDKEPVHFDPEKVVAWWRIHADEMDTALSSYVTASQLQGVLVFIQQAMYSRQPLTYADCLRQIGHRLLEQAVPAQQELQL